MTFADEVGFFGVVADDADGNDLTAAVIEELIWKVDSGLSVN